MKNSFILAISLCFAVISATTLAPTTTTAPESQACLDFIANFRQEVKTTLCGSSTWTESEVQNCRSKAIKDKCEPFKTTNGCSFNCKYASENRDPYSASSKIVASFITVLISFIVYAI